MLILTTQYLAQLQVIQQTNAAQPEQSYYPALQTFLQGAAERLGHGQVQAIVQPQYQDYGVPDFQVQQGQTVYGWAEAKALGGALNHNTNQLRQYRSALHNLLFTNFLTFKLFVAGELYGQVQLANTPDEALSPAAVDGISELLNIFFQHTVPAIQNARQLADVLALRARFLRHEILQAFNMGPVQALYHAYTQYLFPGISNDDFGDVVAQTIVYSLFAAWSMSGNVEFNLQTAANQLPPNIPLLQTLFALTVNNPALNHTPIGVHVQSIATLLAETSPHVMTAAAGEGLHEDIGNDPVMYFYEPFLHAYSPRTAEARGVYYTPLPAVRAMVRLADGIAQQGFGREMGLAGHNVRVLDPATGTGTFLVEVGQKIVENVQASGDNALNDYLTQRFIPNTYGFEFLAAPYTIAHLKLSRFLHAAPCNLATFDRLRVYLTNTLNTPQFAAPTLPLLEALADENQAATAVKTNAPLLVIIGNPPWSGHSENLDVQLSHMDIIAPFKWCDGEKVNQTKWLNNDYVKFLRWSQWRITENEHIDAADRNGVIVMITDNSYLTSPTFRGMRRYLMTQFDRIYVFNLHGNIRSGAAGVADENIFEIIQGVSIVVLIRGGALPAEPQLEAQPAGEQAYTTAFLPIAFTEEADDEEKGVPTLLEELSSAPLRATLRYAASGPGTRLAKYAWLGNLNWNTAQHGTRLNPEAPFYFFTPFEMDAEYFSWPALDEMMPFFSMCVTTGDDSALVFLSQEELIAANPAPENPRAYQFRPFDTRWVNQTTANLERPRLTVMQHLYQENIGLLALKQTRRLGNYNYAFVTDASTDKSCISTEANCSVFPLYRYLGHEDQVAMPDAPALRVPNIREELIQELTAAYGEAVTPEQAFFYVYAILNAAGYRTQYADQLPVSFPHIPFSSSLEHFATLAELGQQLATAQLGTNLLAHNVPFTTTGNSIIEAAAITFLPEPNAVQINASGTTIGGITAAMWNYRVGSFWPLREWLEARDGRHVVLQVTNAAEQVLIDEYRNIVRRVATALPLHQSINDAWEAARA